MLMAYAFSILDSLWKKIQNFPQSGKASNPGLSKMAADPDRVRRKNIAIWYDIMNQYTSVIYHMKAVNMFSHIILIAIYNTVHIPAKCDIQYK